MARSKMGNRPTTVDGFRFASKLEAERWLMLKDMEKHGEIRHLERQVSFDLCDPVVLDGRKLRPVRYVADFTYYRGQTPVVEDAKGRRTGDYTIKRKLMKALLGITVEEWPPRTDKRKTRSGRYPRLKKAPCGDLDVLALAYGSELCRAGRKGVK